MGAPTTTPLKGNRDFAILWLGDMASELGSAMSMLVFPLLGYALTHSTTQAALATTAFYAAGTVVRLPAGALVDRWSRRRVLLVSNLASAAVLGTLALMVATGAASIAVLVVVGLVAGVVETFFSPAASAALRAVVAAEDLAQAYTRMQARHHVASLIGPPLGGALFAVAASLPFALDALSFAGFALAVLFLRAQLPAPATTGRRRLRADVAEGMRFLWAQRVARAMMLWGGILNFSMSYVLIAITLRLVRAGVHPAAIGAIDAIAAAAGIVGAAVASRHAQRLPTGATTATTGLVLAAVVVPMAWTTDVRVIGTLLAIGTFLLPANNAGIGAYLSFVTPHEMQGRLNSAAGFVSDGLTPLAPVVAGALLATFGGLACMLVGAALVAGSVVPLLLEPSLRHLGRPAEWAPTT
ncbi:MAG TPA: MFS transporter [Mycobacteriales bacterium]|nr:MFS transporter [Mycobacteriales bacterium]